MTYTPRMQPNLMGRSTGFQVLTRESKEKDWVERGEFADYVVGDSWPAACSSKNTWERRGHQVQIYQINRRGGEIVYAS